MLSMANNVRSVSLPSAAGIVPVNWLLFMSNNVRSVSLPTAAGIVPVIQLFHILNCRSSERSPTAAGIVPVSRMPTATAGAIAALPLLVTAAVVQLVRLSPACRAFF